MESVEKTERNLRALWRCFMQFQSWFGCHSRALEIRKENKTYANRWCRVDSDVVENNFLRQRMKIAAATFSRIETKHNTIRVELFFYDRFSCLISFDSLDAFQPRKRLKTRSIYGSRNIKNIPFYYGTIIFHFHSVYREININNY